MKYGRTKSGPGGLAFQPLDTGSHSRVYTGDMKSQTVLRSSAVARQVGVSPDTLRLYERKGLLRPLGRSTNGYRCYSHDSVERIRLIRAALSIGFTLQELQPILKLRDAGGVPCRKVRDLAETKLKNLERRLVELQALRQQMRQVLEQWDQSLMKTPHNRPAGLLHSLALSGAGPICNLPPHVMAAITREAGQ